MCQCDASMEFPTLNFSWQAQAKLLYELKMWNWLSGKLLPIRLHLWSAVKGIYFPECFRLRENSLESRLVNIVIKMLVSSSLFCSCWFQLVDKGGILPSMPQQFLKDSCPSCKGSYQRNPWSVGSILSITVLNRNISGDSRTCWHSSWFLCCCVQSLGWTGLVYPFSCSWIMSGKSGSAFQLVYLKSIYIAATSSCNIRFSILLLCKADTEIEIFFLV